MRLVRALNLVLEERNSTNKRAKCEKYFESSFILVKLNTHEGASDPQTALEGEPQIMIQLSLFSTYNFKKSHYCRWLNSLFLLYIFGTAHFFGNALNNFWSSPNVLELHVRIGPWKLVMKQNFRVGLARNYSVNSNYQDSHCVYIIQNGDQIERPCTSSFFYLLFSPH